MKTPTNLPPYEIGFPGSQRDQLLRLALDGTKTATTGLLAEYRLDSLSLPRIGDRFALIDSAERPVAVVEIMRVEVLKLGDVTREIVQDEGEGFTSVAEWRREHDRFWNAYIDDLRRRLQERTWQVRDDTEIVTEWFKIIEILETP